MGGADFVFFNLQENRVQFKPEEEALRHDEEEDGFLFRKVSQSCVEIACAQA